VPERIIEKPPSPDVLPGIVDEEALGIPYEKLDLVLSALEEGWDGKRTAEALGLEEGDVEKVKLMSERSEHMRRVLMPHGREDGP